MENDHGEQKESMGERLRLEKERAEKRNAKELETQKKDLAHVMHRMDMDIERRKTEKLALEGEHKRGLEVLDIGHEEELSRLYREYEGMISSQTDYQTEAGGEEQRITEEFEAELERLEINFQERMYGAQEKFRKAQYQKKKDQDKFEEVVSQMQIDYQMDIKLKRQKLESVLGKEREIWVDRIYNVSNVVLYQYGMDIWRGNLGMCWNLGWLLFKNQNMI